MLKCKQTYSLVLKNTKFSDVKLAEEMFESNILENTQLYSDTTYEKVPQLFISKETWLESCNLKCWACHMSFSNMPVFIPKRFNDKLEALVIGLFCSFCCAQLYIENNYRNLEKLELSSNLKKLFSIFYNKTIIDIPAALDLRITNQYGGDMPMFKFIDTNNEMEQKLILSSKDLHDTQIECKRDKKSIWNSFS